MNRLLNLQTKVSNNLNKLCDFNTKIKFNTINTNSCFDFNKHKLNSTYNFVPDIDNSIYEIPKYKSKIVDLIVNQNQHNLLQKWLNSYIQMYNVVIHYFKNYRTMDFIKNYKIIHDEYKEIQSSFNKTKQQRTLLIKNKNKQLKLYNDLLKKNKNNNNKNKINQVINDITNLKQQIKIINRQFDIEYKQFNKNKKIFNLYENKINNKFNYEKLRTNVLKEIRNHIQIKSTNNPQTQIRTHVLDTAIRMACTSYKSCITNFIKGHIKKFKIKYWRHNKKRKIMEIEKEFIINNKMFYKVFGDFIYKYNNENYVLKNETLKVLYDGETNKYYLLVSEKIDQKNTLSTKYIAIDQGIKPFMACRTNDELIKLGTNTSSIVSNYLKRIDKINNSTYLNKKEKKKKVSKYYLKLRNKIDETHWKIIKHITDNYKYVIIGDLSMKKASNKKTSLINKETKRIGLMMRFSEFRKRLVYKCLINNIKIEIINESYTSRVCSTCSNDKKDIGGNKEYKCLICKKKRDRDLNSATNMILLKM
jgi:IS605 OrfB family transposase